MHQFATSDAVECGFIQHVHGLMPFKSSSRKVSGSYVACKRLGLFNAYVRLEHHMCQIIGNTARCLSLVSPMERYTNLVYCSPFDKQGTHTLRDHSACIDLTTRRTDNHPVTVLNVLLCRQFGTDFSKERRLERVQPGEPACHRSAHVVLG